jgi:hypothetical protein
MAFEGNQETAKKYTNEFLKLFEEYRKENININKWIKRFETVFNQVENLKSDIKKNIEEKDVLGKKVDAKDKEIFESLSRDLETMKKLVVKILTQIEKEDPKISEFIGRISHDEISTAGFSFDLIKEYNKEKFMAVQDFIGLMPNFSKDLTGVIELPMIKMEDSAKHFDRFCDELIKVIKTKPSRGAMFESLGILLNYLFNYVGNVETLSQNDKLKFIGFLNKPNSKKLAGNFLDSIGSAHNIFNEFNNLLSTLEIKLSSSQNDGSTYNSLDNDKKKKIDKFTHTTLKILFNKLSGTEKDKTLLDVINQDIFEEDLSDIQKEFNTKYTALVNSKFTKLVFNSKKTYENLLFICDGLSDYITFKDFMAEKFKSRDKGQIEKANIYLTNLINSKDDKEPFKNFISYNMSEGVLVKKNKDSEGEDSDFDASKQLRVIKTRFESLLNLYKSSIEDLDGLVNSNFDDNLVESSKEEFRNFFIALIGNKKDAIKEDDGEYKLENFEKIINLLSDVYDEKTLSTFLKFVLDNYDNLKDGNYNKNTFVSFFRNLKNVIPLNGLYSN